jgi:mRNA-degrading endonuclease RelE of RelBE toxin-antitoxin system
VAPWSRVSGLGVGLRQPAGFLATPEPHSGPVLFAKNDPVREVLSGVNAADFFLAVLVGSFSASLGTKEPLAREFKCSLKRPFQRFHQGCLPVLRDHERNPTPPGCKRLIGVMDGDCPVYRVRQGDYRILYSVRPIIIVILDIGHRKDVYR